MAAVAHDPVQTGAAPGLSEAGEPDFDWAEGGERCLWQEERSLAFLRGKDFGSCPVAAESTVERGLRAWRAGANSLSAVQGLGGQQSEAAPQDRASCRLRKPHPSWLRPRWRTVTNSSSLWLPFLPVSATHTLSPWLQNGARFCLWGPHWSERLISLRKTWPPPSCPKCILQGAGQGPVPSRCFLHGAGMPPAFVLGSSH